MSVIKREHLTRRRARDDWRCSSCWRSRIPKRLALEFCPHCQDRRAARKKAS